MSERYTAQAHTAQLPFRHCIKMPTTCLDLVVDAPWAYADSEAEGAESSSQRSQLAVAELPLQEPAALRSADQLSLAEARALLDKDHYGLDKVLVHQASITFRHLLQRLLVLHCGTSTKILRC